MFACFILSHGLPEPRLGDRHETSCECDQKNGTGIFVEGNRNRKPKKCETVFP